MDREKVIKGLECHQIDKDHRINCSDCPYHCDEFMNGLNELHNDAIALLKEQEAVVRCKDCKYSGIPYYNTLKCSRDMKAHYDDWFCADGERKEGSVMEDA